MQCIEQLDDYIAFNGDVENGARAEIMSFRDERIDHGVYVARKYIHPVILELSRADSEGRNLLLCDIFLCARQTFAAYGFNREGYFELSKQLNHMADNGLEFTPIQEFVYHAMGLLVEFYYDLIYRMLCIGIDVSNLLRKLNIYDYVSSYFKYELQKSPEWQLEDIVNVPLENIVRRNNKQTPRICFIHALWKILDKYPDATRENKSLFIEAVTGAGLEGLRKTPKSTYAYSNMPIPSKACREDTEELLKLLEK